VAGKKYRAPLRYRFFAFRDQVAIRSPLQIIDFVDNLYPVVAWAGDQGKQMLIQMFACSRAEVGH
jgi:hypothetical protein